MTITREPAKTAGYGNKRRGTATAKKYIRSNAFAAGIIALITLILYWHACSAGFVSIDDYEYILHNASLRDLSWSGIVNIFSHFQVANYHPLTTLTWAIEYNLFGAKASIYHTFNVVLHVVNTILVYTLVFKLSRKPLTAFVVALFFGIHPMHVESVAWISARKEVLYSLFFLLSLIAYLKYLAGKNKSPWYLVTLILFLLSMLSKASGVILPVVLLLIDGYTGRKIDKKVILEKTPFLLLSVVLGCMAYFAQHSAGAMNILSGMNFLDRILIILYALVFYLISSLVPFDLSVMHFYPVKTGGWLPWYFYATPLLLVLIAVIGFKLKRFRKEYLFGFIFFLITIILVLEIIPLGRSMLAERYTYLPYIGLFYIIGQQWSFKLGLPGWKAKLIRHIIPFVLIPLAVIFWFVSRDRIEVWSKSETLFRDVIKEYPEDYYGYLYTAKALFDEKRYNEALPLYTKAVEHDSSLCDAWNNMGVIRFLYKDYTAAIDDYTRAIKACPSFASALQNRGSAFASLKRYREAIADYSSAIKIDPAQSESYYNRGQVYQKIKDYPNAINDFDNVIRLNPNLEKAYFERGVVKINSGRKAEGCADLHKALSLGNKKAAGIIQKFCN